ncbi:MAG: signal recognition particle protein [Candidatus Sumerlaeia bacterium]|nr:signal recognition particle protein [Candidatus Sumerlaeia bacterium]
MFEALGDKLDSVFKKLRGQDKLTEANMKEALREVRLALLEADVNYKVVKDFIDATREKAAGQEVIKGVNPAEQLIKIVHDEMVAMMKGSGTDEDREFIVQPGKLNVVMMLGLQGAGKTTFCGKLAVHVRKKKCNPLLVACDVYRPAAVDQLRHVGKTMGFPVYAQDGVTDVVAIVKGAVEQAKKSGNDVLIIDTAGRLHIDEVKMDELVAVRDTFKPDYTFLVADAMTGQDAVNSARAFNEEIGIDGVCLTKMDGDARGGAALSIKAVTGRPIVFIGTGEKPEDLEPFHPEGVAGRVLGKGDIVSLVRKAQDAIDENEMMDMQEKLTSGNFSYDDFLRQMKAVRRMGPLKGLLGLIPGMGQAMKNIDSDVLERELKRFEVLIQSMTDEERRNGDLMSKSGSRRERVAKGSGQPLKTVNDMVRQFDQMKGMMAQMGGGGGLGGMMGGMNPFGGGGAPGGGIPGMPPMGGMPGLPPGGGPMPKKMLRAQKAMLKQQQRELAASQPRAKKDRRKKKNRKR